MARALPINIYKHEGQDFSNRGLSSRYNEILLLQEDGFVDVDLDNPPENLCILVERELFGERADYIRPYAEPKHIGWMYGGTIVYTSDSRFPSSQPLKLHDRQETQEENEIYSA